MDHFNDTLATFLSLDHVRALALLKDQKALRFHQKYINLCSEDEWRSYRYLAEMQLFENLESAKMQKNLNIEKITFKVVQMKFLAMHITDQKLSFDIFTVGNLLNIFMEHDLYLIS